MFVLCGLLPKFSNALTSEVNNSLQNSNLQLPLIQLTLLIIMLENQDKKITNKFLADNQGVSHTAIMEHLNRLHAKGYIDYTVDPEDRRSKIVLLTEKGKAFKSEEMVAAMYAVEQKLEQKAFRYLSEMERDQFLELFRFVYEGLTD